MRENYIEHEDFLIRIRPTFTKRGEWTGDAEVSVIASEDSTLPKDVIKGMEHFVNMLLSSLPVMERDEYVREKIFEYVKEHITPDIDLGESEDSTTFYIEDDEEDNIVHLTFTTNTKGEA